MISRGEHQEAVSLTSAPNYSFKTDTRLWKKIDSKASRAVLMSV